MMVAAEALHSVRKAGGLVLRVSDGRGRSRLEIRQYGGTKVPRKDIERLLNLEPFAFLLLRDLVTKAHTRYPI